jgi:hypothetical protein
MAHRICPTARNKTKKWDRLSAIMRHDGVIAPCSLLRIWIWIAGLIIDFRSNT